MSARIAKPIVYAFCLALLVPATLSAQVGNNNNNNNGFNQNAVGGVKIDTSGVLSNATDAVDRSVMQKLKSAVASSDSATKDASKLRMVSLNRLEKAVVEATQSGKQLPVDIRFMAGLTKIEFVIASPKTNDIIIAGPGEGFTVNAKGEVVGDKSGLPLIRLEDFIVAMQSVDNARTGEGVSVSINPTEQGIRNLRQVTRQIKQFNPAMQPQIEKAVGNQIISLTGVPKDSRFSHVLVAADYKMKRISMGLDPAPIKNFPSLMAMAKKAKASRMTSNPRFWMECNYKPLAKSNDGLVWQIRQSGVKTLTEEDRYGRDGKASRTGKQNRLAKKWADMMTERYDELAAAEPVFRELQNMMDLSVVAAIIRKNQFGNHVGLKIPTLSGATQTVSLTNGPTPKTVPTNCSFVRITNNWLVATSGGALLDSWSVVEKPVIDSKLNKLASAGEVASQRWWWNAN